jgi:hypothetical protein
MSAVCEERAPTGSRYDRYFVEEFAKKIKNTDDIEKYVTRLREFEPLASPEAFKEEFELLISEIDAASS